MNVFFLLGLSRRGLTIDALKQFILEQGASKNTNLMDITKLWSINRLKIDPLVKRFTAISKMGAVKVHLSGAPEIPEHYSYPFHKKNNSLGNKIVTHYNTILLDAEDANNLNPNGEEVLFILYIQLLYLYIILYKYT